MRPLFRHNRLLACLAIFSLVLVSAPATAEDVSGGGAGSVSQQLIENRIGEVEADADLDDETKSRLIGLYRKSLGSIELARSNSATADSLAQARETASEEARIIREELEKAREESSEVTLDLPEDAAAREIEPRLQQERANQAAVAAKLGGIEQKLANEATRPNAIRERLVEAKQLSEKLAGDFKQPPPPEERSSLSEARRWAITTQMEAVNAEVRMLDQELLSRPMRMELLEAERESAVRTEGRMKTRITKLEDRLTEARRRETDRVIAEADAADAAVAEKQIDHPVLTEVVARNQELAVRLKLLTDSLERVEAAITAAVALRMEIQESLQTAHARIEVAGLSQALGQILHEERRDLPDKRHYQRRARERESEIATTGLVDIQLETERRETQDPGVYVEELLTEVPEYEREPLVDPLETLVASRRTLLKEASTANSKFLRALGELDFEERQLVARIEEFDGFLAQRLLWVRSKGTMGVESFMALPGELIELLDPRLQVEAVEILASRFTRSPLLLLALVIALPLLIKTRSLRRAVRKTAKCVGKPEQDSFKYTAEAVGYTILASLPWPILTGAVGWELVQSFDASDAVKAIGQGFLRITPALFFLSSFRLLCVKEGLAEAHFGWPESAVSRLRIQIVQLHVTFLIPVYVLADAFARKPSEFGGELARVAFIVAAVGVMAFLSRLLGPDRGILEEFRRSTPFEAKRVSWIWLILAAAAPLSLVMAALAGYLYSATTLMSRLVISLWLGLGLVIVHELVSRWLLIIRQRVAYRNALEEWKAEVEARERQASDAGEDPVVPAHPELDLASVDSDTRMLVNVGLLSVGVLMLSAIWSSVLPALSILREINLWHRLEGVAGEEQLVPVTMANFGMALLFGFISYIAARSLPKLLEVLLRQGGTTDPGSSLAYATLTRYAIVIAGIGLVAGSIGFNWSNIQWLVAALGVGIGFGLQEIVANFISGLIILLERPIRIGDIVTVGDVSGTVSRIQIRATTVTTWDRQELLVPNREFVTNRVLNWSLSDEVIRLVLKVGVAYGTDLRKAIEAVREALDEEDRVLEDPRPLITFDEFGDNALHITARVFIESLNNRREVTSALNLAINDKLARADIVIAFPQRDVHLDSLAPIDVRIQPADPEPESQD